VPRDRSTQLADERAERATVSLTIDGEELDAVPGESIAAALTAAGRRTIRVDKRGKPRGILCGMGVCFECRVSIAGGPPERACLTPVKPSMNVTTLRYLEQMPAHDRKAESKRRQTIDCEVLVVGAGPAGATAAIELAEAGRNVVVLDERHEAGGQYFKQKITAVRDTGADDDQYRRGRWLIDRLRSSEAELIAGATVWGAFRDVDGGLELTATTDTRSLTIRPSRLIVATGAHESVPPFPGWTLPGVMTTGAGQGLIRAYRVSPGESVMIAGNGPLNLQLACELLRNGVNVVAVAESAPAPLPWRIPGAARMALSSPALVAQGLGYLRMLKRAGVPLHHRHVILRAEGDGAVRRGTIAPIGADGHASANGEKSFDVDAICLGYRQRPSAELVRALGCRMQAREGAEMPERDTNFETSLPGVYAIGDGAVPLGAHAAIAQGQLAADAILERPANRGALRRFKRHERFQRGLWSVYAAPEPGNPGDDVIVCRCESVTAGTLRHLIDDGVGELNSLKRLSRAGMGLCQGRYCHRSLARLIGEAAAGDTSSPQSFTPRNPIKPVTIADVADEKPEWRGYRSAVPPSVAASRKPPATKIDEADVLIVGAGVTGVTTAFYLAEAGADVLVIDRGQPNAEASGANAGSLHMQLFSYDFFEHAPSPAAEALPLQKLGIELWKTLEQDLGTDFELSVHGGIMLADHESDIEFLRRKSRLDASFGVHTEILTAAETRGRVPGLADHIAGGLFCAGEGKLNPLLATPALLAAARRAGARLLTDTGVTAIEHRDRGYRVQTEAGTITCDRVFNAAGGWAAAVAGMLGISLPVESSPQQMHVTQPVEPTLPCMLSVAHRHLTMKQNLNGNLLIGGGWPATYYPGSRHSVIRRDSVEGDLWIAARVLPPVRSLQVIRGWGGTGVMIDGKPVIGESAEHARFFTAVGANGLTMAPIIGRIVADLVLTGETTIDVSPFSPGRFGKDV